MHLYNALQAVDPNWLTKEVCFDLHCGQATTFSSPNNMFLSLEVPTGGAMPYARNFSLPDSVIVDRLSKRRIHKLTCESYHLEYHPPPADVDPTMIIRRKDDAPEAVRSRIETYREQTHPVEEFFRREGILIEVSGVGSVQDIGNRVLKQVEQFAELAIA